MKVKRAIDTQTTLSWLSAQFKGWMDGDLQNTENENATQGEFLSPRKLQSPDEWHRQYENCTICNDIRDRVSVEELVDIDATGVAAGWRWGRRKPRPDSGHRLTLEDGNENLEEGQNIVCTCGDNF